MDDLIDRQALIKLVKEYERDAVEWLKNHYDLDAEPLFKEVAIRLLHDTANSFMMEINQ